MTLNNAVLTKYSATRISQRALVNTHVSEEAKTAVNELTETVRLKSQRVEDAKKAVDTAKGEDGKGKPGTLVALEHKAAVADLSVAKQFLKREKSNLAMATRGMRIRNWFGPVFSSVKAFNSSELGKDIAKVANPKIRRLLVAVHGITVDTKIGSDESVGKLDQISNMLVSQLMKSDHKTQTAVAAILSTLQAAALEQKESFAAAIGDIHSIAVSASADSPDSNALRHNLRRPAFSLRKPGQSLKNYFDWLARKKDINRATVAKMRTEVSSEPQHTRSDLVTNSVNTISIVKAQLLTIIESARSLFNRDYLATSKDVTESDSNSTPRSSEACEESKDNEEESVDRSETCTAEV